MRIERETFECLVRDHHAAVFRSARRIVRDDADAEDVTQQVFLAVLRGRCTPPPTPQEAERVLRWLASRLALTRLRAGRRRRRHETETAKMNPITSPTQIPPDEVAAVRAAVAALDEAHRTAIVLRYQEGMTLAAIAATTGCAESTVHERVHRAIETLRHRLRELGFAITGVNLDALLQSSGAAVAVPLGLQAKLIALPASLAASPAVVKGVVAVVLVLAAGGAAWGLARGPDEVPSGEGIVTAAAVATDPIAREPDPMRTPIEARGAGDPLPSVAAQDRERAAIADAPRAQLEGVVLQVDGEPLEGATIVAWCRELSRKADPFEVTTRSDARGRFELAVPITNPDGMQWVLRARLDDWLGVFAPEVVHVRPKEVRRGLEARLRRWAHDVAGEWRADVVVTDGAGRAVEGVHVTVFRRQRGDDGAEKLTSETGGTSGANGTVALLGDHLGEKLVRSIPWGKPFARGELALAIRDAAAGPIAVTLLPDTPLEVFTVDARSGAPLARTMITASRGDDSLAVGSTDAGGRTVLRGLDAGVVTLTGGDFPWSRFALDDVPPGVPVTLRLKRHDDPESIGLHGAEIHGRIVDALTEEPVVAAFGSVQTWWLAADSTQTRDELLREVITPSPHQTAMMGDPPPPSASFHFTTLSPGRYALIAEVDGYAPAAAGPIDVAAGGLVKDVTIALERGTRLVVDVRGEDGKPVEGANAWISAGGADAARVARAEESARATASGQPEPVGRGSTTDANGRVVFEHLPSGLEIAVHVAHRSRRHGASAAIVLDGTSRERAITVTIAAR
ncbi:MAG: sigma-70 family RNA polymerase sigma factor [Planctomycetes bacterium]|nr:sigma-70 family RNA polymerase sigma factor [Planctomycetota bacterium]